MKLVEIHRECLNEPTKGNNIIDPTQDKSNPKEKRASDFPKIWGNRRP